MNQLNQRPQAQNFSFTHYRFLILDNDVTTFNTEHLHAESVAEVGKKFGYPIAKEKFWDTVGTGYEETYQIIAEASGIEQDVLPMELWIRETQRYFEEHANSVTVCDDTLAVIEKALSVSMPIAIVSSSPFKVVDRCMEALRRRLKTRNPIIDFTITSDDVELHQKKPHPYPFQLAMERGAKMFNAKPETTIVLEDSVNGVASSVAAGLMTVARPMKFPGETDSDVQARSQALVKAGTNLCVSDFREILN